MDKLGDLPLSPRDGTFPPSREMPAFSFRTAKEATLIGVKEKIQLPAWKNGALDTETYKCFPCHPAYSPAEVMGRREKKARGD